MIDKKLYFLEIMAFSNKRIFETFYNIVICIFLYKIPRNVNIIGRQKSLFYIAIIIINKASKGYSILNNAISI